MIEDLKTLLGLNDNSKDEIIQQLIIIATDEAKEMTGCKNENTLAAVIKEMTIFKYNRLGTEGLDSESYSGVSYHYASDYPESIKTALDSIRKSQEGKGGFKILW